MDLSADLVTANLDNRVAAGTKTLEITLKRLWKTISILEPVVENLRGKTITKSAHTINVNNDIVDEPTLPEPPVLEKPIIQKSLDRLYRFNEKFFKVCKWWNQNLTFPCPIETHNHELYQCEAFLSMSLANRKKICRGRICKTCLIPGGQCHGMGKKFTTQTNSGFLCPGCVAYTTSRPQLNLSPHCILFCANPHSDQPHPSKTEAFRILNEYLGRAITKQYQPGRIGIGAFLCSWSGDFAPTEPG